RRDRETHAGVAGCALDDRAARLEESRALGVLDHLHRHAVLDRVAGVERFDLREDGAFDDASGDPIDADHRRAADGVEDGVADRIHELESILSALDLGFVIRDLGTWDWGFGIGGSRALEPRTPNPEPRTRNPEP